MPRQRDINIFFDAYIKVKLENQKQVSVAKDFGVTPPTIHKWLANVEKELEKASTLQRILDLVGNIEQAAEIMDIPIDVIDAHLVGDMVIQPSKMAHLIVEEGLVFEELCDEVDIKRQPSQDTADIVDVEPDAENAETTKEYISTEDMFKYLYEALNTIQDTLTIVQQRIFTEDDLLSFLESKRTNKKVD